ncbi:MAG TPA: SDR family NAD(P)-dependent oxidoreductase [Solirubrobacterales bacterium]|jgi:NAD(P)-dependent dehydrogenase (short-subunit alcohol dehydrogenase family)|nr:SDR family NAD(P)-dependent oxidoreductase [Solirubrobacterales bacterium]
MKIEGTVAAVFGGASGLGAATARRLADEGAKVVVADLALDAAASLAAEIGGLAVEVDVADAASVEGAVARTAELGQLRIAVNCAGLGTPTKLLGREGPTPLDAFAKVIEVNLLGTINVLRCAAGAMAAAAASEDGDRGVCVNTASIAAYDGQIGQVAYAASKGGVVGLTLPVARELARQAIRVVTIAPGLFDTPLLAGLPAPARETLAANVPYPSRLGDPAEFADLVEHLITNRMVNGEVVRLDGALRMQPS